MGGKRGVYPFAGPSPTVLLLAFLMVAVCALTESSSAQAPLALVPVADAGVKVSGSIEVTNGNAILRTSGTVTAGDKTASIFLPGKGELHLCSTTTVHLAQDKSANPAATAPEASAGPAALPAPALLMALDRGALEASFATGKYSDVLMTPDFRILISGPGQADLRVRVSPQGDTCVENRGDHAPYVSVSSQIDGGLYRVQPDQRVLFEHGSLREVVDHETEPCGCPPPPPVIAASGQAFSNSATAADTAFPLAQSEGLAPAAQPTGQIAAASGEVQTQITIPLVYNGAAP